MTVHTIAQYDTEPPIDEILKDGDDNIIDLTSAVAVYLHAGKNGQTPIIKREALIVNGATGHVRFEFDTNGHSGETAVRGSYIRQWRIDWGAGRDERVPNGTSPDTLLITKAVTTDD